MLLAFFWCFFYDWKCLLSLPWLLLLLWEFGMGSSIHNVLLCEWQIRFLIMLTDGEEPCWYLLFWQPFWSDDLFLQHHFFNWRLNISEKWLFNLIILAFFICSNGIILNTIHPSDLLPFHGSIMICFLRHVLIWEWMKPQDSTPYLMSLGYFTGVIMIQTWA